MAIIYSKNDTVLIDHKTFIDNLIAEVTQNTSSLQLSMKPWLFSIQNVQCNENRRKRRHSEKEPLKERLQIKEAFTYFQKSIPEEIKMRLLLLNVCDTSTVRNMSKELLESTDTAHDGLNGGNNSNKTVAFQLKGSTFIAPPHSRFLSGDIIEQCGKLIGNKYNLIIADPPWWNKFIRRLKSANSKLSYSMMYNEQIAEIPIKGLLADKSLVAVWCTNAPSNIEAIKTMIFPKWGVEYVTTWYWLKITTDLKPVCEFGYGHQKQPFERIIVGKVGDVGSVPEFKLLVSVPSALHSHKPPLLDVLEPLLKDDKIQTLELFARYLLPNTTSVGYEPLKWQHMSLYETVG